MIRIASLLLIALVSTTAIARSEIAEVQDEIDKTVWKTFQQAFERMDGEALNSVYADEVLRATPEGLDTQGNFKQANLTRFLENKRRGDRIALDFWLDSRRTSSTVSYDVGFYRVRVTASSGETSEFYGQFHIVLKKLNGQWKIVQDWDTTRIGGSPITAEVFEREPPAEF